MNFRSMDYFIAVARERNFTKAAEQLYITQQTLSAHISLIEKELKCKLFVRHTPLELTYAGEVFLQYATEFQQKYTSLCREFNDIANNHKGLLRIGIAYVRGRTIMPSIIEKFQNQFPHIAIQLMEASNMNLQAKLRNGEIDLAIGNFLEAEPDIELLPFYREEIVLLIEKTLFYQNFKEKAEEAERKIASGDLSVLSNCPFVLSGPNNIAGRVGRFLFSIQNISPPIVVQSDNIETLLSLCTHGVGACFCPKNLVTTVLAPSQIKDMKYFHLGKEAMYDIRFAVQKQKYQWSILFAFMKIAVKVMENYGENQ